MDRKDPMFLALSASTSFFLHSTWPDTISEYAYSQHFMHWPRWHGYWRSLPEYNIHWFVDNKAARRQLTFFRVPDPSNATNAKDALGVALSEDVGLCEVEPPSTLTPKKRKRKPKVQTLPSSHPCADEEEAQPPSPKSKKQRINPTLGPVDATVVDALSPSQLHEKELAELTIQRYQLEYDTLVKQAEMRRTELEAEERKRQDDHAREKEKDRLQFALKLLEKGLLGDGDVSLDFLRQ